MLYHDDGWTSVEDDLPGIDISVLVVDGDECVVAFRTGYTFNSGWVSSRGGYDLDDVTHWRPLPALPEGK